MGVRGTPADKERRRLAALAYYYENRAEVSRRAKARRAARSPEKRAQDAARMFAWNMKWKYGMTSERYNLMLEAQGGLCAICQGAFGETRPNVDHDHSCCSGKTTCGNCIRGLLCHRCNRFLGWFEKFAPMILRYLERTSRAAA